MKSSLEQQEELLSTTAEGKSKLQIKENKHLFNHIGKLAADHDVTISNTMIKVTYKKALKDQNAFDNTVDNNKESVLNIRRNKPIEAMNLCSNDISFIAQSPNFHIEEKKVFHSTPKQPTDSEKNKNYINGLNLFTKPNNTDKNSVGKVQKTSSSQDSTSGPKKLKTTSSKQITKSESDKRFLKNNNGLVKPKSSIIQKTCTDSKKVKLNKMIDSKIKKLKNGVKKKTGMDKKAGKMDELKQNVSNMEVDVLVKSKKLKISENKIDIEGSQSLDENRKGANKRRIMLDDPSLPTGWSRIIRTKNKGSANEQPIVYIVNPQGRKFRFKWKLRKYLQRTHSTLDVNQFFFGLYERPKPSNATVIEVDEEKSEKNAISLEIPTDHLNETESEPSLEPANQTVEKNINYHEAKKSSDRREILFFDPDLPFGWKRIIHSNRANGRKQVHIISPDGKIFRRRYRLNEYLIKHQYTHNLDRFYFGLYPKKDGSVFENLWKGTENKAPNLVKCNYQEVKGSRVNYNWYSHDLCMRVNGVWAYKPENPVKIKGSAMTYSKTNASATSDLHEFRDEAKDDALNSPMFDDPNLPEGWKRYIKIRSCGESAGRMEVVIVSPDGRRHRSRKHLEHYLTQKQLNYKSEDFDFTVFGKSNPTKRLPSTSAHEPEPEPDPEPEPIPNDMTYLGMKKKFTDKPVPELDINSVKETVITPEGHLINTVNGLMMCCGLSSARSERRHRLPGGEHEKQLKNYLSSENESALDESNVPTYWVQRLIKCRSGFRILEPDALSAIAEATQEFIKNISLKALNNSEHPESGLRYEDIAELVDSAECLSFLKTLIPKKITFREYIKLNRPKQFLSFT